jgi:hypothetical protein
MKIARWLLAAGLATNLMPAAEAGSTAFTYQGRLADSGTAPTAAFDFELRLFDAASDGAQVGSTLTKDDLAVTTGVFSVELDFGVSAFPGADRWLQVAVRPGASTGSYTTLAGRHKLTPSPYAIWTEQVRNDTYEVAGTTTTTLGTSLVDVPELVLTPTFDRPRKVIITYSTMGTMPSGWVSNFLNIDGVEVPAGRSIAGVAATEFHNSATWIGTLSAGSHTVKVQHLGSGNTQYRVQNPWYSRNLTILAF